jgi:hypothetical protein
MTLIYCTFRVAAPRPASAILGSAAALAWMLLHV